MRNTTAYTNKSTLAKDRVIGVNIQQPYAKILDIFFDLINICHLCLSEISFVMC